MGNMRTVTGLASVDVETSLQPEVARLLAHSDVVAARLYPGEYRRPITCESVFTLQGLPNQPFYGAGSLNSRTVVGAEIKQLRENSRLAENGFVHQGNLLSIGL